MTKTCNKCRETKQATEFSKNRRLKDGLDYTCKECKRKIRESKPPYERSLQHMAINLVRRGKQTTGCYKDVENRLGNTTDIKRYLHTHHEQDIRRILAGGQVPTVDRINARGHYEVGNIQILSREENSMAGGVTTLLQQGKPVRVIDITTNKKYFFLSIHDAARFLNISVGSLSSRLKAQKIAGYQRLMGEDQNFIAEYANK